MSDTLSILLISQFAPPGGFSASRRVAGLTKYLAALGHRVIVLTSMASGSGGVEGAARVVRTRDLIVSPISWRRRRFEELRGGGAEGSYSSGPTRLAYLVTPDLSLVGWLPFALPRALRLVREERIDWVLTTSPPESAHFVGVALRRHGVRWVADLRDGWAFETTHPDWPLGAQHRLDTALERITLTRADLVTAVTDPIAEDLRSRIGARAVTLPNGFDPDERPTGSLETVELSADRHVLVHTGRMEFSGRSPAPLLSAVSRLRERRPKLAERLKVVFAGPLSQAERRLIEDAALRGSVRAVGTLPREESLRLQRTADSLLLLTGRSRRSEATAKIYEYLAARRPILVLGERTAAAEIVRQAGAGIVTSDTDPERIAQSLELLLAGDAPAPSDEAAMRWSYPVIAGRLAELIGDPSAAPSGSARPNRRG